MVGHIRLNDHSFKSRFKDAFSDLRKILAIENPLKMMKNAFYFT